MSFCCPDCINVKRTVLLFVKHKEHKRCLLYEQSFASLELKSQLVTTFLESSRLKVIYSSAICPVSYLIIDRSPMENGENYNHTKFHIILMNNNYPLLQFIWPNRISRNVIFKPLMRVG